MSNFIFLPKLKRKPVFFFSRSLPLLFFSALSLIPLFWQEPFEGLALIPSSVSSLSILMAGLSLCMVRSIFSFSFVFLLSLLGFNSCPSIVMVVIPCIGLICSPLVEFYSSMLIMGICLLGVLARLYLDLSFRSQVENCYVDRSLCEAVTTGNISVTISYLNSVLCENYIRLLDLLVEGCSKQQCMSLGFHQC